MKKLIEGAQLLENVPSNCHTTGVGPAVRLAHGLTLEDGNCFHSPFLLLGEVGSGKTTLMKNIMVPVLAHAQQKRDNVVIFCGKDDMLRYRRPGDIVIDINSTDPACCWNLFEEMKASGNPMLTLREIASALFAKAKQQTMQIFFPQAAQDIFIRTCRYLYDYSQRTGIPVSNGDLVEFLQDTPIWGDDKEHPGWMNLAEMHPGYFAPLRDYIGGGNDQGGGVLSELHTLISETFYGSFASYQGTFSAINSLQSGGKRIFLYYNFAESGHSTLTVLQILLDLLLKQSLNARATSKTWYFLDEGSLLPRSEVLFEALSLGRDPGANGMGGCRILMAIQSAKLMSRHYSQQEAETLLSLFPNVIALHVSDSFSRAVLADRYGKAHYQHSFVTAGGKTQHTDYFQDVVSDYAFSRLTKKGQAIMSLPGVCAEPFLYDGYQEGLK